MNFKNVGILDDSIGGLKLLKDLEFLYNEKYVYFADLKEYPYGMKKRSIESLVQNALYTVMEMNLKVLVVTNPAMSYYINDLSILKIDGIKRALSDLSDKKLLVLGSEISINNEILNEYLKDYKAINAQMLINMPHDGDNNYFIINELISEYIGDYSGDVLLFDSNLSLLRKYFEKNKNITVHTLNDYILMDMDEFFTDDLRHLKSIKTKVNYYVSDYRIAFYKSAEEFLEGRYSSVRKLK